MFAKLWTHPPKFIYKLDDVFIQDKVDVGDKSRNINKLIENGYDVPPGFVISSHASVEYQRLNQEQLPEELIHEYIRAIHDIEKLTKTKFGEEIISEGKLSSFSLSAYPLLLSVRGGTTMFKETPSNSLRYVLNIGMNDFVVSKLSQYHSEEFVLLLYVYFLSNFGQSIFGISGDVYSSIVQEKLSAVNKESIESLSAQELKDVILQFKCVASIPENPWEQLNLAVKALYKAWYNPRAVKYRAMHLLSTSTKERMLFNEQFRANAANEEIRNDIGVPIIIQSMVHGNIDSNSGCGVMYSRHPITGCNEVVGDFLQKSIGDEYLGVGVVNVGRKGATLSVKDLSQHFDKLSTAIKKMEIQFKDMVQLVFIVEKDKLYLLSIKPAKRSLRANFHTIVDLVHEKVISERDAVLRLSPEDLKMAQYELPNPEMDSENKHKIVGKGVSVSVPGVMTGVIVSSLEDIQESKAQGFKTIYCKKFLSRMDIKTLENIDGALCGSLTSETIETLKTMGKPVIIGNRWINLDNIDEHETVCCGRICEVTLSKGEVISIDGSTGYIYKGTIHTIPGFEDKYFLTIVGWIDKFKALSMQMSYEYMRLNHQSLLAYVPTVTPPGLACKGVSNPGRADGVSTGIETLFEGIGMFSTENMFLQEDCLECVQCYMLSKFFSANTKLSIGSEHSSVKSDNNMQDQMRFRVRRMFPSSKGSNEIPIPSLTRIQCELDIADNTIRDNCYLSKLLEIHTAEMEKILTGLPPDKPLTFRLLNLDLVTVLEHLIDHDNAKRENQLEHLAKSIGMTDTAACERIIESVCRENPLLGLRGCRKTIIHPEFTVVQIKSIFEAACNVQANHGVKTPQIKLLIPLVTSAQEAIYSTQLICEAAERVWKRRNSPAIPYQLGLLLDTPRSMFLADDITRICPSIDFVTIDTTNLTQMMFGFAKGDTNEFLDAYIDKHIFPNNPFESLDANGVEPMMRTAIEKLKSTPPSSVGTPTHSAKLSWPHKTKKVEIGVVGQHCSDFKSVKMLMDMDVDFLVCPSYQLLFSMLAGAQACIEKIKARERLEDEVWRSLSDEGSI